MERDATSPAAGPVDLAVGVVVIGRNEGERLRRCLRSLGPAVRRAVYVDSGSTDDSVAFARSVGARVVELDTGMPFTAARARNAGFAALTASDAAAFVQFVDGDCEVEAGWLDRAAAELAAHPRLAVVFGRRRERERQASPYNRLCDLEWDVPIGDVEACGGDAMMRTEAFRQCGGFRDDLIAGEEPELCVRLRAHGHGIRRLDAPMTVHDAAMHRFGQWWRRAVRSGYAIAEGLVLLGRGYPRRRAARSIACWVVVLPAAVVLAVGVAAWHRRWDLALAAVGVAALAHAAAFLRIVRRERQRHAPADARLLAWSCVLGRWPEAQGMWTYWWRRWRGAGRRLIEYKGPGGR